MPMVLNWFIENRLLLHLETIKSIWLLEVSLLSTIIPKVFVSGGRLIVTPWEHIIILINLWIICQMDTVLLGFHIILLSLDHFSG